MKPEQLADGVWLYEGDCLDVLRNLPDESVHCCVTSPPYFGLRDYGHDGQIGLEASPDAFVAKLVEVFREVKRVLRDDGTVWLNLGDSYAGSWGNAGGHNRGNGTQREITVGSVVKDQAERNGDFVPPAANGYAELGIKKKDLIGIPWRVAFALQQPYYTGRIRDERDRVWLAAMLDAEGSVCGTEYLNGDRTKTNIYISITNTSVPIIEKCERLFPQDVKHVYEKTNGVSNRQCFRWDVERMETKALFLREVYPYLVAKRKQAIIGYTFIEMQRGLLSKKKGYIPEQQEKRSCLMSILSKLNGGEDVDLPGWVVEPPSLFEPGFYLRQDIIWHKPNPMPESVRDRCTKAHEYVFLLAKSEKYYFDFESVKEPAVSKPHSPGNRAEKNKGGHLRNDYGTDSMGKVWGADGKRNRRSVWTVTTKPYKGAHFATFPPDLIRPCILAGCPPKGKRCDCDEIIASPTGSGPIEDPSMQTGRAGMNRPRRDGEGTRPITRREQRHEAMEMKASPHRSEMERECGPAFAHYIRTDRSGARPLPHDIREKYMLAGWITPAPPCTHPIEDAGTVLDPFAGSGTVGMVAVNNHRKFIGIELNPAYTRLAAERIGVAAGAGTLFAATVPTLFDATEGSVSA